MTTEKLKFLQETLPALLNKLKGDESPVWGKMNTQQMVEHLAGAFRQASDESNTATVTPADQLAAFKAFIMTEKEFRPNTKNRLLGEEPAPVIHANLQTALADLQKAISEFVQYFEINPGKITINPVFGALNFPEWVQLLHKHAVHHLKQFSLLA